MDGTTLKGEFARTDTQFGNTDREGNAYLAELEHQLEETGRQALLPGAG